MRTIGSLIVLFVATLALSGCGGDSGCGNLTGGTSSGSATSTCGRGSGGTNTPTSVASLTVTSSAPSIPTDGSTTATVTVLAKDANNNALGSVPVSLSASAGTLSGASATTSSSGTITATLSGAGVTSGTTITITAASGSISGKGTVTVMATQQTITLLASSPQLPSANTKSVTITAIVQGSNNQLLPGVPVSFQASSGAIVATQTTAGAAATTQVPAGTTDANGTAQALLTTPGAPLNRAITVTAVAGSTTATVAIDVVGTALSLSGPGNLVQGAQGAYSITLVDSGGNAITGQSVTLASAKSNAITPATVTTDTTGTATFSLTATNSGTDTITATWQGLIATQNVSISNQNFQITAPAANATVNVNTAASIAVSWSASGVPVTSGTVYLTSSRGILSAQSSAVSNGALATPITITSATAGPAIISATAVDTGGTTVATTQLIMNFVATVPNAVSVQASPSTVALQGQSTLTASVTDPTGNPVQNAVVDFTLTDTTGGMLSSSFAQTNAAGQASVTYKASTGSSTPNGVKIDVAVQGHPTITGSTALTVGGQTVFLSLGTGNQITILNTTQYELPYTVQAVDAAGNGVSNVAITFSVQSLLYSTGAFTTYHTAANTWILPTYAAQNCPATTVQEYNGVINPSPPPAGVTPVPTSIPGAVVATDVGNASTLTNIGGSATVNLIYPKDHAYWVTVALTATATVAGTQSSTTANFVLPGATADYAQQNQSPPGVVSPYGTSATCY